MPQGIKQAVIGVWVTIALSVIAALINKWTHAISTDEFVGYVIFYSILCVFPYKLSKGSNPTRWVYTILVAASLLFMLGGVGAEIPKADLIASIIMAPIEIFVIFKLFQKEGSNWFSQ